eukprot:TRINITY_DN2554_c0_g1_i1.p1 TRINITY_DN2554_c0_g1~~TRINITY_DN2554_c0_g1_i1.p1  ORF type:complete len:105 (-),score=28.61 TRINITY_DN2554_c0_g1_i1:98-385(-)
MSTKRVDPLDKNLHTGPQPNYNAIHTEETIRILAQEYVNKMTTVCQKMCSPYYEQGSLRTSQATICLKDCSQLYLQTTMQIYDRLAVGDDGPIQI